MKGEDALQGEVPAAEGETWQAVGYGGARGMGCGPAGVGRGYLCRTGPGWGGGGSPGPAGGATGYLRDGPRAAPPGVQHDGVLLALLQHLILQRHTGTITTGEMPKR